MVWILFVVSILLVGCAGNHSDSESTSVRQVLRPRTLSSQRKPVTDFGANLSDTLPDDEAFSKCLRFAIDNSAICKIPRGTLTLTRYPAELRGPAGTTNLNLNGAVLEGAGSRTTIHGVSEKGFDVLNLERVKNFAIRYLTITAEKTSDDMRQGVNGISLTNGSSQISVEWVTVRDLPYVNKGNRYDGGKAFTVQPGAKPNESSTDIIFEYCTSQSNPIGFGVDINPNAPLLPGTIEMAYNKVSDAVMGFGLSSAEKNGGGNSPGTQIRIHHNNVFGTYRPIMVGRGSGVRVEANTFDASNVETNLFSDVFPYPGYPIVLVGVSDFTFSQNTVRNSERNFAAVLLGGASGRANLEKGEVANNVFFAKSKKGLAFHSADGAVISDVLFTENFFSAEVSEPLAPEFQ